ncbi:MAG: xanthine dehydrogenase family protein molybdopterin-binding subunit [Deltaproteobacteria bacterium]|nr:xanthine dehydrogenase family protein molybdopterin-binding subunit [Deltaproteobacteria bacterium]
MTISRRGFLAGAAAGTAGLVVSFYVPGAARAAAMTPTPASPTPNAFLRIGSDDSVTVVLAHAEMGQGIWTGLAMLIAEELDCDWAKVRSEHAPAAPVYGFPGMGLQMTGGSSSTNGEFDRYRTVGATAKAMLLRAAAARWKTSPAKLTAQNGVIAFGGKTLRYGEVAAAAMALPPPKSVTLKEPKAWRLIGTAVRRLDTPEKITGRAQFGIDVAFPGLRTAVVLRPPAFGATLQSFDGSDALTIPGVEQVVKTANGVAVIAAHFWAAKLGRDAVRATWSTPEGGGVSTAALLASFRDLAEREGAVVATTGDLKPTLAGAARTLDATYEVPYLAHAPMEPLNCTVKIDGDRCEIWTGTQFPTVDQGAAAAILGTTPDKVTIHTPFLGGGFGRRGNPASDFVAEAVTVAKAAGVPVKVIWTREDDVRGGYYRPAYVHRVRVGVDAAGAPAAWHHVVVGQSILVGTPFEKFAVHNGVDATSVEGIADSPYLEHTAAKHVSLHSPRTPITVLWWRSVGHTHTAFAMESMIDELAHAAGQDPLAYRLALLAGKPRFARALETAAKEAGWSTPPPAGRARGLAVHEAFGSIVAEVAEVSIEDGRIKVHAVTAAVDCGTAVNPLGIEAQVQGAIAFGLTAALHGKLTIEGGAVVESNFHDYPMLRMFEMPAIRVHVLASDAPMGGIGEPATPPVAPAVANAVFALTRQRLRTLPLRLAPEAR